MSPIKVFILDDHKIVRDGLKSLLKMDSSLQVIGEEGDPEIFLQTLPELRMDILLLDISLPRMSGLDVLKKVKQQTQAPLVLMLSMHNNPEYVLKSIREGASGYLSKDIKAEELILALHTVMSHGSYFPGPVDKKPEVIPSAESKSHQELLTPKERDVLHLIAKGKSSKEIALDFGLSNRTIEAHRLNIMKKLGTNNSAETIAMAAKLRLI